MKKRAFIEAAKCDQSPACPVKRVCPVKAVTQEKKGGIMGFLGGGIANVDQSKCTGCGLCVQYCPRKAVVLKAIR